MKFAHEKVENNFDKLWDNKWKKLDSGVKHHSNNYDKTLLTSIVSLVSTVFL